MEGWNAITQMIREGGSWSGRERDCAFLNTRDGRFSDMSAVSGLDFADDGRACASVDWDLDGDLDLWIANRTSPRVRFMRNEASAGGSFLELRLQGTSSNRDAIGARVKLTPKAKDTRPLIRSLRGGEGYLAQSSKWIHFGLAGTDGVEQVAVSWPGGKTETFRGLARDRRYLLVQGSGVPREWSPPAGRRVHLAVSPVEPLADSGKARIVMASRPPMPNLAYADFDGKADSLARFAGRPYLINLWAGWCGPCREELRGLAEHEPSLERAKLAVVTLCADEPETRGEARKYIQSLRSGFTTGIATEKLSDVLDTLQKTLLDKRERIPLPTSFLVDSRGRLVVIYKGPVEAGQLLDDLTLLDLDPEQLRAAAVPFPGRWYVNPPAPAIADLAKAFSSAGHPEIAQEILARASGGGQQAQDDAVVASVQLELGSRLLREGKKAEARTALEQSIAAYRRVLQKEPDDPYPQHNLAVALKSAGRYEEAIAYLEKALPKHPDTARVHTNLAECFAGLGRHEESIRHLREAVRLQPADPSVKVALAEYLLYLDRRADAEPLYAQVLAAEPAHLRARIGLGELQLRGGRLPEAAETFRRALGAQDDSAEAHHGLSRVLLAQGEKAESLRQARRAVELNPTRPDFRLQLGQALYGNGQPAEALAEMEAVLGQDPRHALALYQAGALQVQLGQHAGAREKLARLEQVNGEMAAQLKHRLDAAR